MGVSGKAETPKSRPGRGWLRITLGVLAAAGLVRFVIALADRGAPGTAGWTAIDTVLVTVIAASIIFVLVFAVGAGRVSSGLDDVRASCPGAIVIPMVIDEDQVGTFSDLTGIPAKKAMLLKAALAPTAVAFWKGRDRLAVLDLSQAPYRVGAVTTLYGEFPCLEIRVGADPTRWLTTFPMDENSRWFPRRVSAERLREMVRVLGSSSE